MHNRFKLHLNKLPGGALQGRVTAAPAKGDRPSQDYAREFRAQLQAYAPFTRLDLLIDCAGGYVNSALGLSDAIDGFKRPVRVLITGLCWSAATLVAYTPQTVSVHIVPGGSVKVHMPKAEKGGLFARLSSGAVVKFMAKTYASKTGKPRKTVRAWMEEGKRFTAEEAVAERLADGIVAQWEWEEKIMK